jgi:hypothetical protein
LIHAVRAAAASIASPDPTPRMPSSAPVRIIPRMVAERECTSLLHKGLRVSAPKLIEPSRELMLTAPPVERLQVYRSRDRLRRRRRRHRLQQSLRFRRVWRGSPAQPFTANGCVESAQETGLEAAHSPTPRHIAHDVQQIGQIAPPCDPLARHRLAFAKVGGEIGSGFGF